METGKAVSEVVMEAVIIRADGTKENLGVVAYWHKNPVKRLFYRVKGLAERKFKWLRKS